ncbi:TonB-dependent receptor [Novosphingobium sp. YJ-S2-02]|uniref:TonB-dependent receptor n=1 Tax=Novosphingobium aureum TaxID=2792964 RepID=A0A931MLH5_9SPHN|nr:TonB-dependent receptor [Novosphingobium aureum]MBH0114052.1 TonB-dependent receptor [Novosphingobium aureum]
MSSINRSSAFGVAGKGLLASISLAALGIAMPAAAQETAAEASAASDAAAAASANTIVVSATRRSDATITDTALSITAFSGEQLERLAVNDISDLRVLDPSVNIQSYGAAQNKIILRGITSNVGATSAMYLNESAVLGGQAGNILGDGKPGLRLHDIERVEVLKGPQGTLFGTSSMAGTLRIITKKPDLYNWGGSVGMDLAAVDDGNPLAQGNATINAPIVEGVFGLRVTGWAETGGGFIDQLVNDTTYYKDANDRYVRGVRAEALLQVTEDFSLLGSFTHQRIDVDGSQAFQMANEDYLNTSPTREVFKDKYTLASLTADYKMDFGSIIASVNYTDQNVRNPKDSTPTNELYGLFADLSFVPRVWFEDVNTELRFLSDFDGPFQIVAGGYYEHTKSHTQTNAIQAPDSVPVCWSYDECRPYVQPGWGNSVYEFGTDTERTIDQFAFYGQVDYTMFDTLTATVGLRYFEADIRDVVTNLQTIYPDFIFGQVTTPSVTGDNKGTNSNTSYNFALLWEATPDVSLYARAASGYRIGGVNTATSLAQEAGVIFPGTFGPDSLWSYELGAKGYLFGGALFFDLTGYHVDWTDQQLSASAAGSFAYTINAGKTTSDGVELNLTLTPMQGLSLNGSVTYVDSKLAEDLPADVLDAGTIGLEGDRVPLSPQWSGGANADYEFGLSDSLSGFFGGNVVYRGSSRSSFNDQNQFNTLLPSYWLVGASAGVRGDGWEASLYAKNLGNELAVLGVNDSIDGVRLYPVQPRTIGVRFTGQF